VQHPATPVRPRALGAAPARPLPTRTSALSDPDRPCISICRYDDDAGWCFACGMTKPEKKAWKRVPAFRGAILAALPTRMEALAAEGHAVGEAARKKKG